MFTDCSGKIHIQWDRILTMSVHIAFCQSNLSTNVYNLIVHNIGIIGTVYVIYIYIRLI